MQTTLTNMFGNNMMAGLAGVSRKTRKQQLTDMAKEASAGIDMARGLQGRSDWEGAMEKMLQMTSLLDQAVDLAETYPGVKLYDVRKQTQDVAASLGKAQKEFSWMDPNPSKNLVRKAEGVLLLAVEAVAAFAQSLLDHSDVSKSLEILGVVEIGGTMACEGRVYKKLTDTDWLCLDRFNPGTIEKKDKKTGSGYKKFFQSKLKAYKVSSPTELSESEKKRFYEEVDSGWKAGQGAAAPIAPVQEKEKKPKLGTGARFDALEEELSGQKGVKDAPALAAWIGRKKHGKKGFAALAQKSLADIERELGKSAVDLEQEMDVEFEVVMVQEYARLGIVAEGVEKELTFDDKLAAVLKGMNRAVVGISSEV